MAAVPRWAGMAVPWAGTATMGPRSLECCAWRSSDRAQALSAATHRDPDSPEDWAWASAPAGAILQVSSC
eukprot:181012-Chlamydomonas_euryale.AAC.2